MLKEKLSQLPKSPGIYKFLDSAKEILYIGKAHNLKARVSSYFNSDISDRPRIVTMLPLVNDIETIQTENDIEALVLESALVKKYSPKYNSDLKDDKSYAWLFINTKDDFPTVKIVRTITKGEYKRGQLFGPYPSGKAIKRVFNYLRKLYPFCTAKDPRKTCPESRIGLCPGPNATKEEYRSNIDNIIKFLNGKNKNHIRELERAMIEYSNAQNYEKAQELRDKISDLKYLGAEINFTYFNSEDEYIEKREEKIRQSLEKLSNELKVDSLSRIECYDISNIQGQFAIGSMVVGINGVSQNSLYRVFKINEDEPSNDPKMLSIVLERRLKHIGKDKDESLNQKPDLILIDGAQTQLGAVISLIPSDIYILGISKGRYLKRKGSKKVDEFWQVKNGIVNRVYLKNTSVLVNLRDEAHRFAITNHRKLRGKATKKSILDGIEGIGSTRRRLLLRTFGSVDKIKTLTVEELNKYIKNIKVTQRVLKEINK